MSGGEFATFNPQAPPKGRARPIFSVQPIKMEHASQQAGRPVFEDQEFVTTLIPGDRNASPHERVTDTHRERWPEEYAAFKAGQEPPLSGTPLTEWPTSKMTPSKVQELAYFNIRTVEDLASVTDAALQKMGMGSYELRATAQKFLEVATKGVAPLERMMTENMNLRAEVERLTALNAKLQAALSRKDTTDA